VYKEGTAAELAFIVVKGEFELQKSLKKSEGAGELAVIKLLESGSENIGGNQNVLARKLVELKDFPYAHKLAIYGPGSLLCEEDLVNNRETYSCTLRCISPKGSLLCLT